jgi:hypothetical protein
MKKLILASLILTVSTAVLAAPLSQNSNTAAKAKSVNTNLDTHSTKVAPIASSLSASNGLTIEKVSEPIVTLDLPNRFAEAPEKMGFTTPEQAEYYQLKLAGMDIPAWLSEAVFGPRPEPISNRDGGDDAASATHIDYAPGAVYTDAGTTIDKTDVLVVGITPPAMCNTSFYPASSFGAGDAWYHFVLGDTVTVGASICDAGDGTITNYDSCLGIFNADMVAVAVNDDGTNCSGYTSEILPCCLPAGEYYLVVDGYTEYVGNYNLTVTFGDESCGGGGTDDPCEDAEQIACGTTELAGSTVGNMNFVGNAAPDAFYELTINEDTVVNVNLCSEQSDYDTYLRLYEGCPTEGGMEIASNDDSCGLQSSIDMPLTAGVYWVVVEGYSSNEGNFGLSVICSNCDPIACEGTEEVEPNNGPDDSSFNTITDGETVCGSVWADAGTRDLDWFEFTLQETTIIDLVCEIEAFDAILFLVNSNFEVEFSADNNGLCFSESLTSECLFPGTYYAMISHNGFEGVVDPELYALSMSFTECSIDDPCEEPITLNCGETYAGSTVGGFDYVGNPAPDAFFEIIIDEDGPITFSLCDGGTDYDSYLRLYDACPVAGGVEITSNDDACGLQSELVVSLTAGTYWLVVEGFSSSEGNYSLAVNCASCDPITCEGEDEGEPNDGPESGEFGVIDCETTICGTTWANDGTRDTDWFELLLLTDSILEITSEAELFDPLIFLIDNTGENILYEANEMGYCEGETIVTDCIAAGTYYVWMGHADFSGVPNEQPYSLTISSCTECIVPDPCESLISIGCDESLQGDDSMSLGNVWEMYCSGGESGPEVVYELTFGGGFLTIDLTSETPNDLDMALLSDCDPLSCLAMPWIGGPNEQIADVYAAGTYYIVVDCYNWDGSSYDFNLAITCGDDPCEDDPIECDGTPEVEPNEGWNAEPPNDTYGEITCQETVCGSTWATGGNRDLDWFRFDHIGGDINITVEVDEFNCIVFLTDFAVDGAIIDQADAGAFCQDETLEYLGLPAGEYYIVVAHNDFEGVPDDQNYALTIDCLGDPCQDHEPIVCDGTAEVEPNEGWNADPPNDNYGEITDGETVCGTVWAFDGNRDLDWFHFDLAEVSNVELSLDIDEFDGMIFLTDFGTDGAILSAIDSESACTPEFLLYECLEAGSYYAVVAHNDFDGVPEDENYALTLAFATCTPTDPCADMVDAGVLGDEYSVARPAPIANHHNAANGCGAIASAGYDELHMLSIADGGAIDVQITHLGEGNADEVVYILTDCNSTESCIASMDANGPDAIGEVLEVTLEPGLYYIVADYWAAGESVPFVLTVDNLTGLDDLVPTAFALAPNYPNPFNPVTRIQWTQPEMAPATLVIHNILGEMVQSFDLGFRSAGVHEINWNAAELSSGVYLYTLSTANYSATAKAILLK